VRIGIDGSCWSNRRGFGRFTRSLVGEMVRQDDRNTHVLLVDSISCGDPGLAPLPGGVELRPVDQDAAPAAAAGATHGRSLRDLLRMGSAARRARCDAFFFPASYSYFPVLTAPVVVTVHDAIAEDLPEFTLPSRGDRARWRLKQWAALREARAVLTVSDASRLAIGRSLKVDAARIHVIREAADPMFVPLPETTWRHRLQAYGLPDNGRYLLYVGGISPHKNLGVLIDAFELVAAADLEVRLVLAGDTDDDPFFSAADSVRTAIRRSPVRDRILLTGFVPDEDLVALYNGAVATALPSLAEGFGLTAAESAACGTPVVASLDPALVELLGEAGLYADAGSPGDLAVRFTALLTDDAHRRAMAAAVLKKAQEWSWSAAAAATTELLEAVGRRRG